MPVHPCESNLVMAAGDPTYPLYPIACILAAVGLLLVLLTSFVRQSWNLGVTFLSFWLFIENLFDAVNAIIWSDNADIKHYVYCDITSHQQIITYVVKPMATLIITRRLYLIASLQSVELPTGSARRWNTVAEWTLGLVIPLLVAGPVYYAHQGVRFVVDEPFGCTNNAYPSILLFLTMDCWAIVPPLISVILYQPKVVRMFYRQRRDVHSFLNSNTSLSRPNYFRILILASIDILLTLPIGIVGIVLRITASVAQGGLPFYWGWANIHRNWEPISTSYTEFQASGTAALAQDYFARWSSLVLAFSIFGLFGLTSEARASYLRIICTMGGWVGWKPTLNRRSEKQTLGEIEFGARSVHEVSLGDVEMGSGRSSHPSFVTTETPTASQDTKGTLDECMTRASLSLSIKEVRRSIGENGAGYVLFRVVARGSQADIVAS
ncbi:STE3-domain-containing protein [Peniophora sp. CONT]|nr:STE3-domain-containing protein [Peniophora sp. CONT]